MNETINSDNAGGVTRPKDGLKRLARNICDTPANFWRSMVRHGRMNSPRARAQAVLNNFYLHIHSVRTHRWTLKKSFTLGLGVATASLFAILALTGIVLMVYYKPTVAEAYNSMKDIHFAVPGGRLLRNIHRWGGHMMVIFVILHMARVFFTNSYQKPREFNWLVGIALLVLTFALAFTGYCLPWDQLAYWAILIGTNIAGSAREITDALNITHIFDIGAFQRRVMLGADSLGDDALLRFYLLHCVALPLVTVVLMGLHFWRIRKDGGMSRPTDIRPEELQGIPKDEIAEEYFSGPGKTYSLMCAVPGESTAADKDLENTVQSLPHAFRAEMAVFMMVLAFLLAVSFVIDAPLKQIGDPRVPENPAKAPWYFLGFQELVSYSAFMGGVFIPGLMVLGLACIPFFGREEGPTGRWPGAAEKRWIWISSLFTFLVITGLVAFQVNFGWFRDWMPGINQIWIILCNPGTILAVVVGFYTLYVIRVTGSLRLGATAFFCSFLVAYIVLTYVGTVNRGPNWDFYWWPSQWSTH